MEMVAGTGGARSAVEMESLVGERRWKLGRGWKTARDCHRCRKWGRSRPEWGKWVGDVDGQRLEVGVRKGGRTARNGRAQSPEMGGAFFRNARCGEMFGLGKRLIFRRNFDRFSFSFLFFSF
jgi:hypothetical protein